MRVLSQVEVHNQNAECLAGVSTVSRQARIAPQILSISNRQAIQSSQICSPSCPKCAEPGDDVKYSERRIGIPARIQGDGEDALHDDEVKL